MPRVVGRTPGKVTKFPTAIWKHLYPIRLYGMHISIARLCGVVRSIIPGFIPATGFKSRREHQNQVISCIWMVSPLGRLHNNHSGPLASCWGCKIWLHEVSIFSVGEFGASGLPLSWRPLQVLIPPENTAIGIELLVTHLFC